MKGLSYLEQRALTAYYRAGNKLVREAGMGQVSIPGDVQEMDVDGLRYVLLTNVNGILALYRVRTINGQDVLKGLKRWPAAVSKAAGVEHRE